MNHKLVDLVSSGFSSESIHQIHIVQILLLLGHAFRIICLSKPLVYYQKCDYDSLLLRILAYDLNYSKLSFSFSTLFLDH